MSYLSGEHTIAFIAPDNTFWNSTPDSKSFYKKISLDVDAKHVYKLNDSFGVITCNDNSLAFFNYSGIFRILDIKNPIKQFYLDRTYFLILDYDDVLSIYLNTVEFEIVKTNLTRFITNEHDNLPVDKQLSGVGKLQYLSNESMVSMHTTIEDVYACYHSILLIITIFNNSEYTIYLLSPRHPPTPREIKYIENINKKLLTLVAYNFIKSINKLILENDIVFILYYNGNLEVSLYSEDFTILAKNVMNIAFTFNKLLILFSDNTFKAFKIKTLKEKIMKSMECLDIRAIYTSEFEYIFVDALNVMHCRNNEGDIEELDKEYKVYLDPDESTYI